jgi:cell division protein FtsW
MVKHTGVDKWLFFVTLVLVVAGLAMVFSASAVVAQAKFHSEFADVGRQAGWALAGVVAMLGLMCVDYTFFKSPRVIFTALAVVTLLLVAVFFFPGSHNVHRWIRFGSLFTFQPSELAKPVMVLFLAWFLQSRLDRLRSSKRVVLGAAVVPVLFMLLIVRQPDLGTALVLGGVTALLLFLVGIDKKWILGAFLLALPGLIVLLLVPWRLKRLMVFLHPESDPTGNGFHIYQSLVAVGAGGLTGRGYMEGIQKLFFLPEATTDFIYANIAEELGLVGALGIVILFMIFGWRGLRTAFRSQDPFARMVAFGITCTIVLQAFFNISVVLSLVPTKGIPLPLISSGGTSLFTTLASIGILLNISRQTE